MSLNEIIEDNLAKSQTDPDIGAFNNDIAELRATIKSLEKKDKNVTTKGGGFKVIGEHNNIEIEILKKEDELRLLEKDRDLFIYGKEIKNLFNKNNFFENRKKSEVEKLTEEINKLEKEYRDRISGVAGFLDKDREDQIEAKIKNAEEKIKIIENSFKAKIKKNEELISKIQNKIIVIGDVESKNVLVENPKQEDLEKNDKLAAIKKDINEADDEMTDEKEGALNREKVFKNYTDVTENDMEEIISKQPEKSKESQQALQEEDQNLKGQELELFKRERIATNEELNIVRRMYYEYHAKKNEQYLEVYSGLFNNHLDKVEAALLSDGDLNELRSKYKISLAKYQAAFIKEALFGLEGEKYEREKIANEKYLENIEKNEAFDAQTLQRARNIEPTRENIKSIINNHERVGARSWFEEKWEQSKEFMGRNSCVLKNTFSGALILGVGIFAASELSDIGKNKIESIKSKTAVTMKTEKTKTINNQAINKKDVAFAELQDAKKLLEDIQKELRNKKIIDQNQKNVALDNFNVEMGGISQEIIAQMHRFEQEQERLSALIPVLQKKYDTMNVYVESDGGFYIGGDTEDGKAMSKDLKNKKTSLEKGHLQLHQLAIELEISKDASVRDNAIKLKDSIFKDNQQLFTEYSNVKISDITATIESRGEFLKKLSSDESRNRFVLLTKIPHKNDDSLRKFLVRCAIESSKTI